MTACTSMASSGDSLFEGPSIPVDAPEFGCVAAQPTNASNMITIAANGIAAASRLRSSTCTFPTEFEIYSTSLAKSNSASGTASTLLTRKLRIPFRDCCSEISRGAPGTLFDHGRASVAGVDTVHFRLLADALVQATRTVRKLDSD